MKYEATGHSESKKNNKNEALSEVQLKLQWCMNTEQDVDPRDNWHVKVKRGAGTYTSRLV